MDNDDKFAQTFDERGGKLMEAMMFFLGILVVWFIVQAWVLPRLGVKT